MCSGFQCRSTLRSRSQHAAGAEVLHEDHQLLAPRHPHEVLRAHPGEAGVGHDTARQDVAVPRRAGLTRRCELDLLRPDADQQVVGAAGPPGRRHGELLAVKVEHQVVAVRPGDARPDQVRLAQEVGDERRVGSLVELARATHLLDLPGVHDRDGVGHGHGLFLVVGHVDEREADLGLDPLELDLHLATELEVQGSQRLVQQQHRRTVDDRPRQRDPLLLPARELGRLAPGHPGQLDQLEGRLHLALHRLAATTTQAERDVLEDVEVREERVVLEDGVHRPLVRLGVRDVLVPDPDDALGRLLEAGDHPQRRGLAAPRRSEQGEERPRRDGQGQVVHGDERAEPLGHVLEPQVLAPGLRRPCHQLPITFWNASLYFVSSSGVSVRKLLTLSRSAAVGKINGLSTRDLSNFAISCWAPTTGQM